jgi:hypothetical protein
VKTISSSKSSSFEGACTGGLSPSLRDSQMKGSHVHKQTKRCREDRETEKNSQRQRPELSLGAVDGRAADDYRTRAAVVANRNPKPPSRQSDKYKPIQPTKHERPVGV